MVYCNMHCKLDNNMKYWLTHISKHKVYQDDWFSVALSPSTDPPHTLSYSFVDGPGEGA